ncbi:Uncharacterized protein PBTT_03786 [Plasmodiophora brassicae]
MQFLCVAFSKDRAFQLRACLTSMQACMRLDGQAIDVHVIYAASTAGLAESYKRLARLFPMVAFHRERERETFQVLLDAVLNVHSHVVFFVVDDCVFYREFSLGTVAKALGGCESQCLAFHLRLHKNITRSFNRDGPVQVPPLFDRGTHYQYLPVLGTSEWCYEWDLSGCFYRTKTARQVMDSLSPPERSHPNKLEVHGNEALGKLGLFPSAEYPFSACPLEATMSIITVNRVQDVYQNPTYNIVGGSVLDMDALLAEDRELDLERYAKSRFQTVHIGSLYLRPGR